MCITVVPQYLLSPKGLNQGFSWVFSEFFGENLRGKSVKTHKHICISALFCFKCTLQLKKISPHENWDQNKWFRHNNYHPT